MKNYVEEHGTRRVARPLVAARGRERRRLVRRPLAMQRPEPRPIMKMRERYAEPLPVARQVRAPRGRGRGMAQPLPRRRRRRVRRRPNYTPAPSNLRTSFWRWFNPREYPVRGIALRHPTDGLAGLEGGAGLFARWKPALIAARAREAARTAEVAASGLTPTAVAANPDWVRSMMKARIKGAMTHRGFAACLKYARNDPRGLQKGYCDALADRAKLPPAKKKSWFQRATTLPKWAVKGGKVLAIGAGVIGTGFMLAPAAAKVGTLAWSQRQKVIGAAKKIGGQMITEQMPGAVPIVDMPGTVPTPPMPSPPIAYANDYPSGTPARRTSMGANQQAWPDERAPGALDPEKGKQLVQGAMIVGGIVLVVGAAVAMRGRR